MKDRATWGEWHEWSRRHYLRWKDAPWPCEPALLAPPDVDQETFRRNVDWMDRAQWPRCAQIVAALAATGRWPAVPPELRWLLAQRLAFAMEVLTLLAFGKCPLRRPAPESGRSADIVRWLLVDAWRAAGHAQWVDKVVAGSDVYL